MSDGQIEIAPRIFVPESGLRMQYARSSGPGGQNVNKVNTKAEIWLKMAAIRGMSEAAKARLATLAGRRLTSDGEIHIASDAGRSQAGNRAAALEILRGLLIQASHEPKRRKKTKPSKASRRRRLETKRKRGEIKSLRQNLE
jgi:ribosome-associated protein